MLKKLILSTLASVILLVSILPFFATSVRAQAPGPWYMQTPQEWYVKVYDEETSPPTEIFGERYTAAQVQWVIYGLFSNIFFFARPLLLCLFTQELTVCVTEVIGPIIGPILGAFGLAEGPSQEYYAEGSGSLLAAVFAERQFSGITYLKDAAKKFHLIPEAKAQQAGFGYEALAVIRDLWQASRNVTYLFFVLIIIITAFMIMFRVKLSPQTVISVQSALPRIVIALILVTFSYAIAGFLVDLMYVATGLISIAVAQSGLTIFTDSTAVFNWLTRGTLLNVAGGILDVGVYGMLMIYAVLFVIALFTDLFAGAGIFGIIIGTLLTAGAFPGIAALFSIIVGILLFVILLYIFIKILWMLIKAFATILLLTIVAPFQIALGVIAPAGSPGLGFGAWSRNFVANLAVFPLTGLFITLAYIFLFRSLEAALGGFFSWPGIPLIDIIGGSGWPPLLSTGFVTTEAQTMSFILLGVSLGIMLLTPKIADIVKSFISGRPFAYGTGIGQAFGPLAWGAAGAEILASRKIAGIERVAGEGRAVGWEVGRQIAGGISKRIQGLGR